MARRTLAFCLLVASCASETPDDGDASVADAPDDTGEDAAVDTASADVEDVAEDPADDVPPTDAAPDVVEPPEYARAYPSAADYDAPDGFRWARGIVHLHSAHSHDACDDMPRMEDGSYNEACLTSLRDALCEVRIDVAWLTDHPTHMTEVDAWADLLLHDAAADTLVVEDDVPVANLLACDDGHEVIVRVGSESAGLMPLGLHGHVADTVAERERILGEYTAEAAAQQRSAGALVWVAHTEGRQASDLLEIGVEGMEIYQLHAGIDPRIRGEMGIDATRPLEELGQMLVGRSTAEPDLAFLSVAEPNVPSLETWGEVLRVRPAVGTAGTDAHENSLPMAASDGERIDSYRRMMSWFANYLLVDGELTWASAQQALAEGRVTIVFDVFGDAAGMDFAVFDGETRYDMGTTLAWSDGLVLRGNVPTPIGPSGLAANARFIIWQLGEDGWEVADELPVGAFEYPVTEAGIYRAEVVVTSEHLLPYLGELAEYAAREVPWITTNAWRVGLD